MTSVSHWSLQLIERLRIKGGWLKMECDVLKIVVAVVTFVVVAVYCVVGDDVL